MAKGRAAALWWQIHFGGLACARAHTGGKKLHHYIMHVFNGLRCKFL